MRFAIEGSDGGALATPGGGRWGLQRRCAATVRFGDFQNKNPRRISPCGLDDFRDVGVMPVICPTCQTVFKRSTIAMKFHETKFDETVPAN